MFTPLYYVSALHQLPISIMIHVFDNDADEEKHKEASKETHQIKTNKEADMWECGTK